MLGWDGMHWIIRTSSTIAGREREAGVPVAVAWSHMDETDYDHGVYHQKKASRQHKDRIRRRK